MTPSPDYDVLEELARAVVETRAAYHLGEDGPNGLDLSFAYDDAVTAFNRVALPFENTILALIAKARAGGAAVEALETVRNAGLILLKIVDETDEYQKRPESGDWGVECACCMGELFQCDRADINTARTALSRIREGEQS